MQYKVQEIVWDIEETIMSVTNNKRTAVQLFRNAKCLRDDFRTYSIVLDSFHYLTYAFCKHDGMIWLTNTLISVGGIASKALDVPKPDKNKSAQLGSLIVESMIKNNYLTLHRESYSNFEEIIKDGEKTKVRYNPYHLELGSNYSDIKLPIKERNGISIRKFPKWENKERMIMGCKDVLVKGNVEIDKETPPEFIKSINSLEEVQWEINSKVAEISIQLRKTLTDTNIRVKTKDGQNREFDVTDIKRESTNKELKDLELYYNDELFEPHKGNNAIVKALEFQMVKIENQIKKIKKETAKKKSLVKKLKKLQDVYGVENKNWLSKQTCLRVRSQANRDEFILNTIHGDKNAPGWLGYKFYLANFLDFRGRIYARDPYFSYQSSDLARGHMMFAEKRLMTDKGYRHLLVHIANSFNQSYTVSELKELTWLEGNYIQDLEQDKIPDISVDKMNLQDRINWAENNLEMMLDIALDPIESKDIWFNAEKPWVFLSLCFEVVQYLAEDGDYYSQIPIAIDGTVNGTQHLAAMSKDEIAGKMVGLVPQEKPIDFYVIVAKGIIKRNIDNDLGKVLAKIPMKLIRKGISKRGTMTKAYDAGVKCIANIIYTDCYDAGMTAKYGITRSIASKLAKDLVETYNSLCSGPVAVKNYLQALTKHRIKELGYTSAKWKTPSGFPVNAEKWITRKKKTVVRLNKDRIDLVYHEVTDKPALHEIMSGISPNYVHSMDASHMCLVINKLKSIGVTSFGAIHDSFSVHADEVDKLLNVTKDVFIKMYSCDVMLDMMKQFIDFDEKFEGKIPKKGHLNLSKIRESEYFFC